MGRFSARTRGPLRHRSTEWLKLVLAISAVVAFAAGMIAVVLSSLSLGLLGIAGIVVALRSKFGGASAEDVRVRPE